MLSINRFGFPARNVGRPVDNAFAKSDGRFARALAFGLLLGAVVLSPTFALAGPPVTIDVTVTGTGGAPVSGATVTVTKVDGQLVNPTAATGGGKTGKNGKASINTGKSGPRNPSQPLQAGVYQVDVTHGGVKTTTYVHVPEGQTGTPTIDLSKATSIAPGGKGYADAADDAAKAAQAGNQAAYDAAVARINEIIDYQKSTNDELEAAIEQYRRDNRIPFNDLRRVGKLLKRHREAMERGFGDPAMGPILERYRGFLELIETWKRVVEMMEKTRDDIPSFSHLPSAESDSDTEHASADLPWQQPVAQNIMVNRPRPHQVEIRYQPHHF